MAIVKGIAAFAIGMLVALVLLAVARQAAFGDGMAVSPRGLSVAAQIVVAIGWFAAASVGTWVALRIASSRTPGLFVTGWLFQMTWLSPGVRPFEVSMRVWCAALVALGGLVALVRTVR